MSSKVKIHWGVQYGDKQSNALGYSVHNDTMFKYVSALPDVEITDKAEDCLLIVSADWFESKVPDKINWLFTMFEGTTIPNCYIENIQRADRLLVPCSYSHDLFRQHYSGPIHVCPEGVEPQLFTYKKRKFSTPFRFLWVGAPNPRKGYEEVILAWLATRFVNNPRMELYIKTTKVRPVDMVNNPDLARKFESIPEYEKRGNIIFDSRKLPIEELVELYHSAHVLLHPTRGEGWGLILCEAMCTGLPAIATPWSGVTEFFDGEVGLPLKYVIKQTKMRLMIAGDVNRHEEVDTGAAFPCVLDLCEKMDYCWHHYNKVRLLGKAASERIRNNFTWEQAARKLVDIIKEDQKWRNTHTPHPAER